MEENNEKRSTQSRWTWPFDRPVFGLFFDNHIGGSNRRVYMSGARSRYRNSLEIMKVPFSKRFESKK